MRNDLTTAFLQAMKSEYRKPIQLAVFHFSFGDVFVSDQDINLHGVDYSGLVEDWGTVATSGYDVSDIISETLEVSISLWNGGKNPFSDYFIIDEPINVFVDLYQTFHGLSESDIAIIGQFVIQDPIEFSEASRLLNIDLVSPNMRYTANIGKVMTELDWPSALEADLNKGIDLIIGDAGTVKTLCAKTPLTIEMKGSILKLPTIVNVYGDLDDLGFAQNGHIVIGNEIMHYSSRDEDTFIIDLRGQFGSKIEEHSDGSLILEHITDHTYIIGAGPISSISNVRINTKIADPSSYTTDLSANPATITFTAQPSFDRFATGARTSDYDFDDVAPANGAYQPHYAFDTANKAQGAIINQSHTPLAILQTDSGIDDGDVVRVFLAVEHWETGIYDADSLNVSISGIGFVGSLSKPNSSDIIDMDADVDIDHNHQHETGVDHTHNSVDTNVTLQENSHPHGVYSGVQRMIQGSPYNNHFGYHSYNNESRSFTFYYNFNYNNTPSAVWSASAQITFSMSESSGAEWTDEVKIYVQKYHNGWYNHKTIVDTNPGRGKTYTIIMDPWSSKRQIRLKCVAKLNNGDFGSVYADFTNPIVIADEKITQTDYAKTNAYNSQTQGSVDGLKQNTSVIKDENDVKAYIAENKPVNITSTSSSSKKVVDKFDLTKHLETIDWAWLANREVQIQYSGSANDVDVFVTYANFIVEYRPKETIPSNDVYVDPVGSIENRPDAVLQYILHDIAGIPLSSFDSIWANPAVWDDLETWDDSETWIDAGEATVAPPGAYFEEAAARFDFLNYNLDGVLSATETVQSAAQRICKQSRSRLVWSAGKIKLAVQEKGDNWITSKYINSDETRLKSILVSKEPVAKIFNDIDLFYKINRKIETTDASQYSSSVNRFDQKSIDKHGQRKNDDEWMFDLIRNDSMAADLVDYYIWNYGLPITRYHFDVYLQQFDTEKGDTVRLTSDFARLNKLPLRVSNNTRVFGSGKQDRINTIQLIGDSIRHRLLMCIINDNVVIDDVVDIDWKDNREQVDTAIASEEILITQGKEFFETIETSDAIEVTTNFNLSLDDNLDVIDNIQISQNFEIFDSVGNTDSIAMNYKPCFGACGFGLIPFGSPTVIKNVTEDMFGTSDFIEFVMSYNVIVDDSVVVDDLVDVVGVLADTAEFNEELIFSSGFGSPVAGSSGFGSSLFGF